MIAPNPMREALTTGRFCYVVELVASRTMREAQLLQAASQLAQVPGIVGAGITSYAGGSLGQDPIRVGAAVRARGLTPNIHITCVSRPREEAVRALEDLNALGLQNVFAITGDYPKVPGEAPPFFDIDSVQLVEIIQELRERGMPFFVSVAVSPFKYTEPDCAYQYLKLEKKIAAGADCAITQLGFDSRKFRELKRYLDERGLRTPVLGNVYILPPKAAERMSKGDPPGCWVSPELVARIQEEAKAPDKGLAARLERAARMAAMLRGLGYAGVYLGGDHRAERIQWIIKRAEELAPNWEEYAKEISYGPKNGFYFYEGAQQKPKPKELVPKVMDTMGRLFPVTRETKLRSLLTGVFRWVDRRPAAAHALERLEFAVKSPMFGCHACGNCVLGAMEYVCPMTCPKNLRNGPCGGTSNGKCEVVDKPCIWVGVYEHAKSAGEVDYLKAYIPPRNRALQGTSSWINYFLNRDARPDNVQRVLAPPPSANGSQTNAPLVQIKGSGK